MLYSVRVQSNVCFVAFTTDGEEGGLCGRSDNSKEEKLCCFELNASQKDQN